ncbi:MAG TPA: hypothetical protein DIS79_08465 [Bacteroidetes bacterium]|nr:hypothetical protein [Bacteroidota bacterium]
MIGAWLEECREKMPEDGRGKDPKASERRPQNHNKTATFNPATGEVFSCPFPVIYGQQTLNICTS